jgi:membrane protein YdbS with pleckstrin-like domain
MTERIDLRGRAVYRGLWSILVRWFRVPELPPVLPATAEGPPRSFRPHAAFLSYLKLTFFIVALLILAGIAILVIATSIAAATGEAPWPLAVLFGLAGLVAIVFLVIAYVAIHLRYDTTWYVMSDRSLRIRRGIWAIHEVTITFENVQNVKVSRGPLEQLFRIARVVVETAGSGGQGGGKGQGPQNRAIIEGIANPDELRDTILARLRRSHGAGLGDDDDDDHAPAGLGPQHIVVLREIRDIACALRDR